MGCYQGSVPRCRDKGMCISLGTSSHAEGSQPWAEDVLQRKEGCSHLR